MSTQTRRDERARPVQTGKAEVCALDEPRPPGSEKRSRLLPSISPGSPTEHVAEPDVFGVCGLAGGCLSLDLAPRSARQAIGRNRGSRRSRDAALNAEMQRVISYVTSVSVGLSRQQLQKARRTNRSQGTLPALHRCTGQRALRGPATASGVKQADRPIGRELSPDGAVGAMRG